MEVPLDKTILIVDDIEINRIILAEGFKDNYNILEAENGRQAIEIINSGRHISAVFLDLIMPEVGGLDVLREMNKSGTISHIPVFIVTAADTDSMLIDAYNLGAVDVIQKPFMLSFLKCRVDNIIELYRHRNNLETMIDEKVMQIKHMNELMVTSLANIIEFRDGESGEHVKRISGLTRTILTDIVKNYPEYYMTEEAIDKISAASILHDVGKIAISDSILNKPGRLTNEEFAVMKLHTVKGCEILVNMTDFLDAKTYEYSYDICRHHHERWDGRGYPDGIKGDDITIWSQVVAVADVYDALISPRVYKAPFEHDVAVKMIYNGECGAFNPKVLDSFNRTIGKQKEQ